MLTESQVLDRWQALFRDQKHYEEDMCVARNLLGELSDYSPIRERLTRELSEIESLRGSPAEPPKRRSRSAT